MVGIEPLLESVSSRCGAASGSLLCGLAAVRSSEPASCALYLLPQRPAALPQSTAHPSRCPPVALQQCVILHVLPIPSHGFV